MVVDEDERIIEAEPDRGEAGIGGGPAGEAFQGRGEVVTEVADQAAPERRAVGPGVVAGVGQAEASGEPPMGYKAV